MRGLRAGVPRRCEARMLDQPRRVPTKPPVAPAVSNTVLDGLELESLSGLAKAGPGHPKIDERHEKIGFSYEAKEFPVEILTLSEQDGTRLRATVSEFGPVLLSRILGLSEVQEGILAILFQYCDDNQMGLLDLKDLKKVLQYATGDGRKEIEAEYGRISTASTGAILRRIVALEQQGGDLFFGERSFEVQDLCRVSDDGRGHSGEG